MIDIKFLRENPEIVKENIKKKFQMHKLPLVDEVIELDKKSRELILKGDELRSKRNSFPKRKEHCAGLSLPRKRASVLFSQSALLPSIFRSPL